MAMLDDATFLISHIQNSFITSDDTGMCELIIESEEVEKADKRPISWHVACLQLPSYCQNENGGGGADSGTELGLSHSYDIMPDMDYGAHRRRSNTAQRLERLKKEKRNQIKVKHISWKDSPVEYSCEEHGHFFEKKKLPTPPGVKNKPLLLRKKGTSVLSQQLQTFAGVLSNPFLEYAKYDGKAQLGVATRKIDIFLPMLCPASRGYPMHVVVVAHAKVHELIGLICWQYTNEGREPALKDNISMYCLHIAEDDGEVDMDFPSLDNGEPVSKFGFNKLALVELDVPSPPPKSSIVIIVNVPNRGFSKFQEENVNKPLKEILRKVLKKRKIEVRHGLNYVLEKQNEPGVAVDLDCPLSSLDTTEFCLVREHSTRGCETEGIVDQTDISEMAAVFSSPHYKCYIVNLIHRMRANTEVHLGVSWEKVEINPVGAKGTAKFFRQKAVTYNTDVIASCDLMETKSGSNKSIFRITCMPNHDYRHYDFEADSTLAQEIVQKVTNILDLLLSSVRKGYVAAQAKKQQKKESNFK